MPVALQIAQFLFAFTDKIPALIAAGVDISAAYTAHKAKVTALATAEAAPTDADWQAMHTELNALETSIQGAHRDAGDDTA